MKRESELLQRYCEDRSETAFAELVHYGPILSRLKLSPDQIARVEELIIQDAENQIDLETTAQSQGLALDDPVIKAERQLQTEELDAAELALLGQPAFEAVNEQARAEPLRGTAERIATLTVVSANPISGAQFDQLLQLMAHSSSDYANGNDATPESVDWNAVLSNAANFLAPSQLDGLRAEAERTQYRALARQFASERASVP